MRENRTNHYRYCRCRFSPSHRPGWHRCSEIMHNVRAKRQDNFLLRHLHVVPTTPQLFAPTLSSPPSTALIDIRPWRGALPESAASPLARQRLRLQRARDRLRFAVDDQQKRPRRPLRLAPVLLPIFQGPRRDAEPGREGVLRQPGAPADRRNIDPFRDVHAVGRRVGLALRDRPGFLRGGDQPLAEFAHRVCLQPLSTSGNEHNVRAPLPRRYAAFTTATRTSSPAAIAMFTRASRLNLLMRPRRRSFSRGRVTPSRFACPA